MKDRLHALISKSTGNCLAICSNVDDAITLQIGYENRNGEGTTEIMDATKGYAIDLVRKEWVAQPLNIVEMTYVRLPPGPI